MERSHYWEPKSFSAGQEMPCILCNPKVHYRVHYSLPLVSILIQINPNHALQSCIFILILFQSAHMSYEVVSSLQVFLSIFCIYFSYLHVYFMPRFLRLGKSVILITGLFGESCKWWFSSLCNFLRPLFRNTQDYRFLRCDLALQSSLLILSPN
jgi:hypothetical protein